MKRAARLLVALLVLLALPHAWSAAAEPDKAHAELLQVEADWAKAIMKNDADAAGKFVSDDWIIIDAQGGTIDRATFLSVIKSGALTHDSIKLDEPRVRVYGDTAVVTGKAVSSGKFGKEAFNTSERSTDVFVKRNGKWLCVLTQLTKIVEPDPK
jgi:ketosteroid isomerase-like protein